MVIEKMSEIPKPFEFIAGALCLDFVNTVGSHGFERPREKLPTYSDLVRWSKRQASLTKARRSNSSPIRRPTRTGHRRFWRKRDDSVKRFSAYLGRCSEKSRLTASDLGALNKPYGNSQFDWKFALKVTISAAREKLPKSTMNGRSPRLLGQQPICLSRIRCTTFVNVQTRHADGFLWTLRKTTAGVGAR